MENKSGSGERDHTTEMNLNNSLPDKLRPKLSVRLFKRLIERLFVAGFLTVEVFLLTCSECREVLYEIELPLRRNHEMLPMKALIKFSFFNN